jgi:serine/threonine-protein kinase mTOR
MHLQSAPEANFTVAIYRYKQTADTVLCMRDTKHSNVKIQVMLLIPKMSAFAPEKFVCSYLDHCALHLLNMMTQGPTSANTAFASFGQMVTTLAAPQSVVELRARLQTYVPEMEREVMDACCSKHKDQARRNVALEAIACAATLAEVCRT